MTQFCSAQDIHLLQNESTRVLTVISPKVLFFSIILLARARVGVVLLLSVVPNDGINWARTSVRKQRLSLLIGNVAQFLDASLISFSTSASWNT
jgi:hypothetical protein